VHTHEWVEKQSASFDTALTAKIKVINSLATLETKTTAIYKINYAQPETLAQQLDDVVKSLAAGAESDSGATASFVVDQRSNSLIVQASASDMIWIKETIDSLDKPTKQVKVEVFIVEATDNFAAELGTRVGIFNSDKIGNDIGTVAGTLGGATPTAAGEITTATTGGSVSNNPIANPTGAIAGVLSGNSFDLRVELQAMQTENLIKIVSNPKLFIVDNEEALIEDGTEVPYNTVAQAGSTPTTEFKTAALTLKVTPQIIDDGNIYLDVEVNKDTPLAGSSPPPISTKQLKTKLLIKDGGVALIGGITQTEKTNAEDGVPFLKDLPFIGNLFKSNKNKNNKNTLYIFIAPEVI
jgi:type IV pilus assembly protein PilQ